MKKDLRKGAIFLFILFTLIGNFGKKSAWSQSAQSLPPDEFKILQAMHSLSSHRLLDYVRELVSDKYGGRLTGTPEYKACAEWVAGLFKSWGLFPGGDNGSYIQTYPLAYTLVFPGCELILHLPVGREIIKKYYQYETEFIPGATSASGEITAEVVYVGYGITAPELGYDDYANVEVQGKIVLMEREVPVSPDRDPDLFLKWRPYSFHQYKLENAFKHGAKGMLYNYGPICNPNNSYIEGFIYSHVGERVINDLFAGTGKNHQDVVRAIEKTLKPQSFKLGKTVTIRNNTQHFPNGTGENVIALLLGSDPKLKDEVIILGAHLDHLGRCWELMPGANDNASGVAVILGVAEVMAKWQIKPGRSIMFLLFGSEEQGVYGSEYYLEHPVWPLEKTVCFLNLDGVGCGDRISVLSGKNFPALWAFIERANNRYIHRIVNPQAFANLARPRLDAARFLWKGIPSLSFSVSGAPSFYHLTKDSLDTITPEILEDLAQLLFLAILDMADEPFLNFKK
ncbi:MAG: M28 family peptidase [Candidatus Aminicenantes bacterium]|nr:M28 family peptidase [Candidatus Aminicenantes bacterium]